MFPAKLIRHQNPEIFFAIVAPVGADVERVCESLEETLKRFAYKVEPIKVIEQLKKFKGYLQKEPGPHDERIEGRMDAGDGFREKVQRNDALAILALSAVVTFRSKQGSAGKPLPRQAYLFRSLKRPEEVTALRRIYGSNLIVIGVHCGREKRVENLSERIAETRFSAQREQFRDRAERLILRDESDEGKVYGQRLRLAFALADFFLDSSDPQAIKRDLERFLNLLFGKPVITPTPDELSMAHAYVSAMRSAELGRQVGAAIANQSGNLITVGTNEVPKAHGGYYWDGELQDARDWSRGFDSSDHFQKASLGELLQILSSSSVFTNKFKKLPTPQQIQKLAPLIKKTRYMQLIEFVRAVHAEMSALLDAALRGVAVAGCTMYVTTFPCHECAKQIVAAGIARVVYIEPYAKSLALELHSDAIQLDEVGEGDKIPFIPFLGVAPRNYANFFSMSDRKLNGNVISWDATTANPRVSGSFWSYLPYEKEDLKFLTDTLKKKGFKLGASRRSKSKRT